MISLIVTEIREGVGIRRGSVIGDFPLYIECTIYSVIACIGMPYIYM